MRGARGAAAVVFAAALASGDTLAVRVGDAWHVWWRSASPTLAWSAPHAQVTRAIEWRAAGPGLAWGTLKIAGSGKARRISVIVVRAEPSRFDFALQARRGEDGDFAPWTIADADSGVAVALNAGQFNVSGPWGWRVAQGREQQAPGMGPLSAAFVVDLFGTARVIPARAIDSARTSGLVRLAFQSYPTLLEGGRVPAALQARDRGVNVTHRDSRVAIGVLRSGEVVIAITRFDALGGALDEIPFGPNVAEMAAIMGALGAVDAVLLDGGISGQLLVRDSAGAESRWPGLRRVPMGLVLVPKGRAGQ